jgi:hypothetical protein
LIPCAGECTEWRDTSHGRPAQRWQIQWRRPWCLAASNRFAWLVKLGRGNSVDDAAEMLAVPTRCQNSNVVERRVRGDHTVGWCGNPGYRAKARLTCPLLRLIQRYDGIDESFGVALEGRPALITTLNKTTHTHTHTHTHTVRTNK